MSTELENKVPEIPEVSDEPKQEEKKVSKKRTKKAEPEQEAQAEKEEKAEPATRESFVAQSIVRQEARKEYQESQERLFATISRIREAKYQGRIVSGYLISVEQKMNQMCAVTMYEGVKVYIPFNEMFCDAALPNSENDDEKTIIRRQRQIITKSLGARINFIIDEWFQGTDESDLLILGNRKKAQLAEQARYYVGRNGLAPVVQEGKTYEGQVIGVGAHGIRCCVYGVDTQIWTYNLTYRCVDDLASMYVPGQTIRVEVNKISNREDGAGLAIEANARRPELEQYRKNLHKVTRGALCMARVVKTGFTKAGTPIARLFLDDMELPAVSTIFKDDGMRRPIRQGDCVIFRVDEVGETGVVRGAVTNIICDRETHLLRKGN